MSCKKQNLRLVVEDLDIRVCQLSPCVSLDRELLLILMRDHCTTIATYPQTLQGFLWQFYLMGASIAPARMLLPRIAIKQKENNEESVKVSHQSPPLWIGVYWLHGLGG